MRTMLLSFKADVYKRVLSGEKIYEHRKVFPDEPITAYLYISAPIKSIAGIMHLNNKIRIERWKEKYSYDDAALQRINEYINQYKFAMEITDFQNTNMISLEQLRIDIPSFIVPQMYYFIDNTELLSYLKDRLKPVNPKITHSFDNISSDLICKP